MLFAHVGSRGVPEGMAWDPHLDVLALAAVLVVAYWAAIRRLAPKHAPAGQPAVERRHVLFFGGAIATLLVFSMWPIHDLAEGYLLSIHMVQHAGLTLVFPPLL